MELKSSVPLLEFDVIEPDRAPERPPLATVGAVWSIINVKFPDAVPPKPAIEAVMNPALPCEGVSTIELPIPLYDSISLSDRVPKVALVRPPLAEKLPIVEYMTTSASAGVTVMNASADKASTRKTAEILRGMFLCYSLSCLFLVVQGHKTAPNSTLQT